MAVHEVKGSCLADGLEGLGKNLPEVAVDLAIRRIGLDCKSRLIRRRDSTEHGGTKASNFMRSWERECWELAACEDLQTP